MNTGEINNLAKSNATVHNPENGQEMAKQNVLGHSKNPTVRGDRRLPPTHKDYWKPRLMHATYTRGGKLIEVGVYGARLQHVGRRAVFNLGTSDRDAAATKARDIYIFLKANGWDAALAKFKPKAVAKNKLTLGDFLSAVQATGALRERTRLNYENCLRSIAAGVFRIKNDASKYDYRTGGNKLWRERIDSIRLEKLLPEGIEAWMKKFVAAAGRSPTAIASAKRTANTYVRCARSLFSPRLLKEAAVKKLELPAKLPFAGVELFEAGSAKYISKINAQALIAAAKNELKANEPEVYKAFLLGMFAAMRKGEIDLCEWRMVDWSSKEIKLEETQWLHLKTQDSAAVITVEDEFFFELRPFKALSQSAFIITSDRPPRNDTARPYYRCEPVFDRLTEWLRSKGVTANKPLHELRKEVGALLATEQGIYKASKYLRHSDITTTSRHYVDHKTRISVGIGKYLNTTIEPEPQAQTA